MAITMQGSWTVQVKSKNAAFQQRFVIEGSTNGKDGTYEGSEGADAVTVAGPQWSIAIQHKPSGRGAAWQSSAMRLGTPASSGGQISVDIFSNDSGGGDADYDDLILTCAMPESASEYVVYGKVRTYTGLCLFNPCFPILVIDTAWQLQELLNYQVVRGLLQELYPDRLREFEERRIIPQPDPGPFRPIMIPTDILGQPRQVTAVSQPQAFYQAPLGSAYVDQIDPSHLIDIGNLRDRLKLYCSSENAPGVLLRFQEYDRTTAELAGAAYSGDGDRETLGWAATDEIGNYLFRFSRDLADYVDEIDDAASSDLATELRPDLLVQAMSGVGAGAEVLFETGLHANIPNLRRINLCIPEEKLAGGGVCQGLRAIQAIGNISLITPETTFDALGRVTTPGRTKNAWVGTLDLFACFLDHPEVSHYTIKWRRPGGSWTYVQEPYEHTYIPKHHLPNDPAHKVGPFPMTLGGDTVPAYKNIEMDNDWLLWHRSLKIQLSSALYAPNSDPGPVEFMIEGHKTASGGLAKVAGAEDNITLYIDNRPLTGDIDTIEMGGVAPGECAFFDMPSPDETLTIRFKVDHPGGLVKNYKLKVFRGSYTVVPVSDTTPPAQPLNLSYDQSLHGDYFFGTFNAVSPDGDNYVVAQLQPDAGSWLPEGKEFCAFAFEIWGSRRVTNGYGGGGSGRLDLELVGIQYKPAPVPTP